MSELASRKRCHKWFKSAPGRRLTGLPASRYGLAGIEALQEHDGDLSGRLLAVFVEGGVDAGVVLVEALIVPVAGNARPCLELLAAELDRDLRVGDEVVVPGGIGGRASLGRDDHVVLAVTGVNKGVLPNLARLRPLGCDDEKVAPEEGSGCGLSAVGTKVGDQVAVEVVKRAAHT